MSLGQCSAKPEVNTHNETKKKLQIDLHAYVNSIWRVAFRAILSVEISELVLILLLIVIFVF